MEVSWGVEKLPIFSIEFKKYIMYQHNLQGHFFMDEYYRKKLLNKILEENASEYNKLKEQFKNVDEIKLDRRTQIIDFPLWLLLIREPTYVMVQSDILEEYKVESIWKGDIEGPFQLLVKLKDIVVCLQSFCTEDSVLKAQEKTVFLIEQKMFSPPISC